MVAVPRRRAAAFEVAQDVGALGGGLLVGLVEAGAVGRGRTRGHDSGGRRSVGVDEERGMAPRKPRVDRNIQMMVAWTNVILGVVGAC